MSKKPVRILLNVLGTLAALILPTMINVVNFMVLRNQLRDWFFVMLKLLLLTLLIIFPLLAMRKSLHFHLVPLYASIVGFLISARMTPLVLPFFSENHSYGLSFGGAPLQTLLDEVLFAIPFACAAPVASILLTLKYRKKKQAGLPVLCPHELDFSA